MIILFVKKLTIKMIILFVKNNNVTFLYSYLINSCDNKLNLPVNPPFDVSF